MSTGRRLVALAGLTFVALNLPAVLLMPPAPALGTDAGDLVAYYQDIGDRFLVLNWLTALGIPLMIAYSAAVAVWLRRRDMPVLGAVHLASGVMTHTLGLVVLAVTQVAAMAAQRGDAAATRMLADLGSVVLCCAALAEVGRQVTGGLAIRRTGVVPRWLAWLPFTGATLCLFGSAGALFRSGALAPGSPPMLLWAAGIAVAFTAVNVALLRVPPDRGATAGPVHPAVLQLATRRPSGAGRHRRTA